MSTMRITQVWVLFLASYNVGQIATTTTTATTSSASRHHHQHVHTRPTREPVEAGSISFQYDHFGHLLAFKDGAKNCYIYWVPPGERTLVHSETGFFQLQTQIVTMSVNATVSYPRDDLSVRSTVLPTFCPDGYSLYKLN